VNQWRYPFWVKRGLAVDALCRLLSVVGPIGDKTWCRRFVREVPKADIRHLLDDLVSDDKKNFRRVEAEGETSFSG
jgi:hypothetical protein